ncbi:hypothetical protein HYT52_01855 [Candidatus Woesearchaeota archaeon]|nr:hypothetical protein [Candidatus Woesearchaeota archaeon]
MNNRGSLAISFVAIVAAIIILSWFLIGVSARECNRNAECSADSYCGADHSCHQYPETILLRQTNFFPSVLIMGISVIIAALIFRKR